MHIQQNFFISSTLCKKMNDIKHYVEVGSTRVQKIKLVCCVSNINALEEIVYISNCKMGGGGGG